MRPSHPPQIEQVGRWALEELLLLRADAYFARNQRNCVKRCFRQWAEQRTTTESKGEDLPTHFVVPSTNEADTRPDPALDAIEDDVVRQTLRALEGVCSPSDALALRSVALKIQGLEKANAELISTVQFDFQHVSEEKIATMSKGNDGLGERIKLSRVIQNVKALRFKAGLLGVVTGAIDGVLLVLDRLLLTHNPSSSNQGGGVLVSSKEESNKTIYESADSGAGGAYVDCSEGAVESPSETYNSHLRSSNFGFDLDRFCSEDEDAWASDMDEIDECGTAGASEQTPFGLDRAKQLLHSLQTMKDVGERLY